MLLDSIQCSFEIQKVVFGARMKLILTRAIFARWSQNATVLPNHIGDEFLNTILFFLRRKLGEFDVGFYRVLKAPLAEVARDIRLSSHVLFSFGYCVVCGERKRTRA